ncbi:hypothetical protein F4604DRAFT_93447 [Suillus subluteus]|nr:hypothetical protein F4604DRAFT_93447 [Suillus subluteus]
MHRHPGPCCQSNFFSPTSLPSLSNSQSGHHAHICLVFVQLLFSLLYVCVFGATYLRSRTRQIQRPSSQFYLPMATFRHVDLWNALSAKLPPQHSRRLVLHKRPKVQTMRRIITSKSQSTASALVPFYSSCIAGTDALRISTEFLEVRGQGLPTTPTRTITYTLATTLPIPSDWAQLLAGESTETSTNTSLTGTSFDANKDITELFAPLNSGNLLWNCTT